MPSFDSQSRHASGSASSRNDTRRRNERSFPDKYPERRSPDWRHRSSDRDFESRSFSERKRDGERGHDYDGHYHPSTSSYGYNYPEDRPNTSRQRSPHAASRHDSDHHHRRPDRRDRSPRTERERRREPEQDWKHGWDAGPDDDKRPGSRPYGDRNTPLDPGRSARASHFHRASSPDGAYRHSGTHSRGPEDHHSSRHDRRYSESREPRHHDSHRRVGRSDRSRSRSREPLHRSDTRDRHRPSTSRPASHAAAEPGELIDQSPRPDKDNATQPPPPSAPPSRPQPPYPETARKHPPLSVNADQDDDRHEALARSSSAMRGANGFHQDSTSGRDSHHPRTSDINGSHPSRTIQTNGHSRSDREDRRAGSSRRPPSPVPRSNPSRPETSSTSSPAPPRPEDAAVQAGDPRPPPSRSFGHVPLPHELDAEQRGQNAMVSNLIDVDKEFKPKWKTAAEKQVVDAKVLDPRKGRKLPSSRTLHRCKFIWDANSVGIKPLPPPRNLVITGLTPLIGAGQVLPLVRTFGRISASKLEMHPAIGQSLGIFCITFAHDFDERGKVVHELVDGQTPQNGAKAAKAAQLALNGRQIGPSRIITLLDREGEVVAEQVKLSLAASQAKRSAPNASAAVTAAASSRPSQSNMPPPDKPRASRPPADAGPALQPQSSSSVARQVSPRHDPRSPGWRSSQTSSSYADEARRERPSSTADLHGRRREVGGRDASFARSHTSRSESSSNEPSTAGVWEHAKTPRKIPKAEIMEELRAGERHYAFIPKPKSCDVTTKEINEQMANTGARWIRESDDGWYAAFDSKSDAHRCRVANETLTVGAYTLRVHVSNPPAAAAPASRGGEPKSNAAVNSASAIRKQAAAPAETPRTKLETGLRPLTTEEKQKTQWTAAELQDAVFRMLQKELAEVFLRDVKSRVVGPHLTSYLKPDGEGGKILAKAVIKKPAFPSKALDRGSATATTDGEARLPSFRKLGSVKTKPSQADATAKIKSKHDQTRAKKQREPASKDRRSKDHDYESEEQEDDVAIPQRRGDRALPKSGTKKRGVAAWLLEATDEEAESDDAASTELDAISRSVSASVEPSGLEQNDAETATAKTKKKPSVKAGTATRKKGVAAVKKGAKAGLDVQDDSGDGTATPEVDEIGPKAKLAKASVKAKPIPADPFEAGLVEDAEDLYFLRQALERLGDGGLLTEESWPEEEEPEAVAEDPESVPSAPAAHLSGSARTEGMYRIAPAHKAAHLPDRNKASEEGDAGANAQVLQSARNNRADSRRLVLGIEQHKRETATDTDIFKFNQLRTRKKQLKFAKSPIHDWGLYAMELIPAGDMVIEYVGEVVRQQVADEREKQYERQGNFSTYLFRVDDDLVVDATHKGNIARLMNHCCTPNCNAKILTLNGEKRIVLFAKSPIRPGEELTYDYKFQSSADDEDAIPCLCGSPGCRRFL